ncbi:hypothetical protein [Pseudohalioglobus lutimaris]|uniref:Uncharacterized protein n=1 Tax=Pseudohalioglobus lutimaris TaxID=1737061 RepID=A0A2N5X0Z1_9GAMM|nr:hypothetical protein [Pseudohalioglobus lutimaris]PLW68154.1 hypothetical protein C0039_13240 [Pseudohalioglobus lutimaris]
MTEQEPAYGYTHGLAIHEAVGRMIGYKQQELTYDEVLDCAIEQAESRYQAAVDDQASPEEQQDARERLNQLKQTRAKAMAWNNELNTAADDIAQGLSHPSLVLCSIAYHDKLPRFTIESLHRWAEIDHGLEIPEWASPWDHSPGQDRAGTTTPSPYPSPTQSATWGSVEITFCAHDKILVSGVWDKPRKLDLIGTGLNDRRFNRLNMAGTALLGLAQHTCIQQEGNCIEGGISKKVASDLRKALREITGIDSDPFYKYNQADGWKPKFTVSDRRRTADERAKEKAVHTSYDDRFHGQTTSDEYTFEEEEDEAGRYIREHG